jgi:hypothetical protein
MTFIPNEEVFDGVPVTEQHDAEWIEAGTSLSGPRGTRVLDCLAELRDRPQRLLTDNGPELTGLALERWTHEHQVQHRFITPGNLPRTVSLRASVADSVTSASTPRCSFPSMTRVKSLSAGALTIAISARIVPGQTRPEAGLPGNYAPNPTLSNGTDPRCLTFGVPLS